MKAMIAEDKGSVSFSTNSSSGHVVSGRGNVGGAWNKKRKKFNAPICYCGTYAILFQTSTSTNPNRLFFGCSNFKTSIPHCRYFVWLDEYVSSFPVFESEKADQVSEHVKNLEEKM
ncbi:hypothetical protein PIB30_093265, partial [Stylosanthes scabra]|nr:hypothetical protein [Stylosanthes scabra]